MWKYLRVLFLDGFKILWAYFAWMIKYSRHPEKYPYEVRYNKAKKLISSVLRHFHVKYDVNKEEVFKGEQIKGNRLIVSNHLSFCDPLVFIAYSDRFIIPVAKYESRKMPFVGRVIKAIDGQFLKRDDLKQQLRVMLKIEQDLKTRDNIDYLIFPEGKRNKDPKANLLDLHHGTFRCAVKSETPIVITTVYNTFKILSLKANPKYFDVKIDCLDILKAEDYKDKTTKDVADYAQKIMREQIAKYIEDSNN